VAFESTRQASVFDYEKANKRRVAITLGEAVTWYFPYSYQFQSTPPLEIKLLKQLYLTLEIQYDREFISERKVELLQRIRNVLARLHEKGEDVSQCYLYQYEPPMTQNDIDDPDNEAFIGELSRRAHMTINTPESLVVAGLKLDPYAQIKQGVSSIAQLMGAIAFSIITFKFLRDPLSMPWLSQLSTIMTRGSANMMGSDAPANNVGVAAGLSEFGFYQLQAAKTTGTITLLSMLAVMWMLKELADNMLSLSFAVFALMVNSILWCFGGYRIPLAPAGFNELVKPLTSWENFCAQGARFFETFAKLGPVWVGMGLFVVLVNKGFGHVDLTNDLPDEPAGTFSTGLTIESASVAFLYGMAGYLVSEVIVRNSWDFLSTKLTQARQLGESTLRTRGFWKSRSALDQRVSEETPLLTHSTSLPRGDTESVSSSLLNSVH
jgi:hypothetical protein